MELDFITYVDILKIIVKEQKVFLKKLKTIPQKTINKEIINNENINIYEVEALFEDKLKKNIKSSKEQNKNIVYINNINVEIEVKFISDNLSHIFSFKS